MALEAPNKKRWGLWGCAGLFLLFAWPVHYVPFNYPADDSFFYLQVARNIAAGHGSTFNEITRTNGYHPLWMLCCITATVLSGGHREWTIHVVFLFQQACAAGILLLAAGTLRRMGVQRVLPALAVLSAYFLSGMYASEAHINGLLVVLLAYGAAFVFVGGASRVRLWLFGLAGSLAFLARLDNVFLVGVALLAAWAAQGRRNMRAWLLDGLALAGPCAGLALAYLAYNLWAFGHAAPISGAIKSTFPHMTWNPTGLGFLGAVTCLAALASLAAAGAGLCMGIQRRVLAALSLGVLLHAAYTVAFTDHATNWTWYYVPGVIQLALAFSIYGEALGARKGRAFWACLAACAVLMLAVGLERTWMRAISPNTLGFTSLGFSLHAERKQLWKNELAEWIQANLPPGSRMAVYDSPAVIAYRTDVQILPTDGLMGDYAYNDDILESGFAAYMKQKGVTYWMGPDLDDGAAFAGLCCRFTGLPNAIEIEVVTPLDGKSAGLFHVSRQARLANLREVLTHSYPPNWGIWRLQD